MIDWDQRKITGKSGKVYTIAPERVSVARWHEFLLQGSTLAFNSDFETLYKSYGDIEASLTSGNDILAGINKSVNIARQAREGLKEFVNNTPPKLIKFASIFCISEGEDISIYDEPLIKRKYEDWKHIPMSDFFLLSSQVMPYLKEALQKSFPIKKGEGPAENLDSTK